MSTPAPRGGPAPVGPGHVTTYPPVHSGVRPAVALPVGPPQQPGPARPLVPTPMETFDHWLTRHGRTLDAWLAAAAFVMLGLIGIGMGAPSNGLIGSTTVVLASIGMPLAMAVRRRWPVASAVAVNALALLHFTLGGSLLPVDVLIYASVYSTTVHGPRWASRTSLASALLGSAMVAGTLAGGSGWGSSLATMVFAFVGLGAPAVISWALGLLRTTSRQRGASLRERATRLERERTQQATIAVAAERARIAREMHDVVAHSLSIVVAQADGGRYAAQHSPEAAARALETIATTGRTALKDMRRILGVLRSDDGDSGTAPQPDAGDIEALVQRVRESGVDVTLVRTGAPVDLPAGMGLAVYRICQEALTNVLKHAGPPQRLRVRLDLAHHPGVLVVQIDDDGRGAGAGGDGAGQGLVGMRERVALFGGTLWAGPRPGGGYRVYATFPVPR